jgi:hypothetical protein
VHEIIGPELLGEVRVVQIDAVFRKARDPKSCAPITKGLPQIACARLHVGHGRGARTRKAGDSDLLVQSAPKSADVNEAEACDMLSDGAILEALGLTHVDPH